MPEETKVEDFVPDVGTTIVDRSGLTMAHIYNKSRAMRRLAKCFKSILHEHVDDFGGHKIEEQGCECFALPVCVLYLLSHSGVIDLSLLNYLLNGGMPFMLHTHETMAARESDKLTAGGRRVLHRLDTIVGHRYNRIVEIASAIHFVLRQRIANFDANSYFAFPDSICYAGFPRDVKIAFFNNLQYVRFKGDGLRMVDTTFQTTSDLRGERLIVAINKLETFDGQILKAEFNKDPGETLRRFVRIFIRGDIKHEK